MVSWRFFEFWDQRGRFASFGVHINPRYYSFGESTWDLVFFIGTGALGPLGSWQTFLLAVVNVLMQVPSGRLNWRAPRWQYPVGEPSQKSFFVAFPGFSIWIVGVPSLRDAGRILDDVRST
jgi:hypothetical protein